MYTGKAGQRSETPPYALPGHRLRKTRKWAAIMAERRFQRARIGAYGMLPDIENLLKLQEADKQR